MHEICATHTLAPLGTLSAQIPTKCEWTIGTENTCGQWAIGKGNTTRISFADRKYHSSFLEISLVLPSKEISLVFPSPIGKGDTSGICLHVGSTMLARAVSRGQADSRITGGRERCET